MDKGKLKKGYPLDYCLRKSLQILLSEIRENGPSYNAQMQRAMDTRAYSCLYDGDDDNFYIHQQLEQFETGIKIESK